MRIAVIGGVATGPAAAAEAKRVDPAAEVVLFEQGAEISYSACEMPYYVAGWIERPEELVTLSPETFERTRGARVRTRHRVTALEPRKRRLVVEALDFGSVHEERFDRFILAAGARARRLGIEGEEAPNVFTFRRFEDALRLRTFLETEPVRHAVIVGAGYVGLEMAEALRARGVRVTLLAPEGRVLAGLVGEELQEPVHGALARNGVQLRAERAVRLDRGADGLVRAVWTDRRERIGCQLVLEAVGLEPNVELAVQAGAATGASGAVRVDAGMATGVPNLWACGDCAEVTRVVDGRSIHWPLSPTGHRTAYVAARNAARRPSEPAARFEGVVCASAVRVFGVEAAAVGLRLEEAAASGFDAVAATIRHHTRSPEYPGASPLLVRLVVERGSGRLLGGELVGGEGAAIRADVLVPLVRDRWSADRMRQLDLIYTPPVAPSREPLLLAASAAAKEAKKGVEGSKFKVQSWKRKNLEP